MQTARDLNSLELEALEYDSSIELVVVEGTGGKANQQNDYTLSPFKRVMSILIIVSVLAPLVLLGYGYISSRAIIHRHQEELRSIEKEIALYNQKALELKEKTELDLSIDELAIYAKERLKMSKAKKENVVVLKSDYDIIYDEGEKFNIATKMVDFKVERPFYIFNFAGLFFSIFD